MKATTIAKAADWLTRALSILWWDFSICSLSSLPRGCHVSSEEVPVNQVPRQTGRLSSIWTMKLNRNSTKFHLTSNIIISLFYTAKNILCNLIIHAKNSINDILQTSLIFFVLITVISSMLVSCCFVSYQWTTNIIQFKINLFQILVFLPCKHFFFLSLSWL